MQKELRLDFGNSRSCECKKSRVWTLETAGAVNAKRAEVELGAKQPEAV
jgi:hypothetical protein